MADRRVQASLDGHLGSGSAGLGLEPLGQGRVGRERGQLVHHPGGIGGGVSAERPSDRVAEPVARADGRVQPARRGQANIALQIGRAGTIRQALQRDVLLNGGNHA